MIRMKGIPVILFCLFCFATASTFAAQTSIKLQPLDSVVKTPVSDVKAQDKVILPIITWGGDIATIYANGNTDITSPNSIFGKSGLKFKLVRMDDFKKQIESYMSGESPFLRGTLGMINMALDVISKDPRTKPVIIYQLTWSNGGDCLVVKGGINSVKDLKGATIAAQAYGPHQVDYVDKILKDGGLTKDDVNIIWTKDITGTEDSPGEIFRRSDVKAAFVISSDASALTSKMTVGTGSDASVKGARALFSTKTASNVIADVYAVRSDYFAAHQKEIQNFVHGLLLAEQELKAIFQTKQARVDDYKKTVTAAAKILLDSPEAVGDVEGLYSDCKYVGFPGNVKWFTDEKWPRNFVNLTDELQSILISGGMLKKKYPLEWAKWNYRDLAAGLANTEAVEIPKFQTEELSKVVEKKRAMGTLQEGELFSFEIYFQPNQNTFPPEIYTDAFNKVVGLASTYGGSVIVVEGHSDPLGYLKKKREAGASDVVLRRIEQAAKNLSLTRALGVRDSVMEFAKAKGVNLDSSQFSTVGYGISHPKTGICGSEPCAPKTKEEWLSNMRVVFRVIQVEAEESAFSPMN
jgi:outer membrane protein OmpA-like peptidoglycan-associated protein/ABC-type nitrate/sulfonate/bicarbonate transport system substrate-binding protein